MINITARPTFEKLGSAFKDIKLGMAIQKGIETLAYATERYSKIIAPKDTGTMARSIDVRTGRLKAEIGPHVDYAIYVHEGTHKMGARPFMEWGYTSAVGATGEEELIADEVMRYIDKELKII